MGGPHLRFGSLLSKHPEWIAVHRDGRIFPLRNHEIEFDPDQTPEMIGFLDHGGFCVWRVESAEVGPRRVFLELSRRFGAERTTLELIPRLSAEELGLDLEQARLSAANRIAEAVAAAFADRKVRRVSVNGRKGRFAQIILEGGITGLEGVIADVSGAASPEQMMTSAILWHHRASMSSKRSHARTWIVARKGKLAQLKRLHACIADALRSRIKILSLGAENSGSKQAAGPVQPLALDDLWREKARPIVKPAFKDLPREAAELVERDRGNIDHLYSRNGATIRFKGLPFARTRFLHGREGLWFGVEKARSTDWKKDEISGLLEGLAEYRRHDSPNKQHLYYQAAPEAWLESLLRRNIRKLDPNLVVSPVYNQFRAHRDRIDLLALSRRGRLAIVEVKVSADPVMVFQAVDYWRRIELQRRSGLLAGAGLFGRRRIEDVPAMIFLAAPSMCFGPETRVLVEAVSEEIPVLRFELNEDWRREVKVLAVK